MRGEHIIGSAKVGARGQLVLPKDIRKACQIKTGDTLIVSAHEGPDGEWKIVLHKPDNLLRLLEHMKEAESRIRRFAEKAGRTKTPGKVRKDKSSRKTVKRR
jgi:AbrB family looped-hinge helix DNA binding protein